jgi:8-oxo-dGTP pyrophosphatase MutT (NUDIX family)
VSEPHKAATVLLVRQGRAGIEVFMVQRHRRSGFLPSAWVFPGGRVDAADLAAGEEAVSGTLDLPGLDPAAARGVGVAAVRETREEASIFLGARDRPDLSRLRAWSWWVTPTAEPKRFDTRFLLAVSRGEEGIHDGAETVDSRWVSPQEVAEAPLSEFPLAPPTWWTLRELARHPTVDHAWAAASGRPGRAIQPVMEFTEAGMELLLPGHPRHADPAVDGFPDHVGWDGARWVASRSGARL